MSVKPVADPFIIAQKPSGAIEIWRRKRTRYYFAAVAKPVGGTWEISGPRIAWARAAIDTLRSVIEALK